MTFRFEADPPRRMTVIFDDQAERDKFMLHPCNGKGQGQRTVRGFQKFVRMEVTKRGGLEFPLDHAQTENWIRHATAYGTGGFQGHLGRKDLLPLVRPV